MARFPSGITPLPSEGLDDARARAVQMSLEIGLSPVGMSAPCMNPECCGPVDFLGSGMSPLYCSNTCRSRASALRALARSQLETIERTLDETQGLHDVPREELRRRARMLQWWLARLSTREERKQ